MKTRKILHAGMAAVSGIAAAVLIAACSGTLDPQPQGAPQSSVGTPPAGSEAMTPGASGLADVIAEQQQESFGEADRARAQSQENQRLQQELQRLAAERQAESARAPAAAGAAPPATVETIVVTGSRIRRDDYTATNATTVITAEDMRNLGVVSVAEMIAQLPENVSSVEIAPDVIEEFGLSVADLRGLNAALGTRTLTLSGPGGAAPSVQTAPVDLTNIPTALVGGIETVTGGAGGGRGGFGAAQAGQQGQQSQRSEALQQVSGAMESFEEESFEERRRSPLSRVVPGEELWIISREVNDGPRVITVSDDALGSGVMIARFIPAIVRDDNFNPAPVREVPLPLKHTDVDAKIQGYVGTVDVTQQFENPYDEKIEAVYMFPLPEKAAVSEFVMTIGERRIRGILRAKEEAQQIYAQARAQGYQASLLTQHRPNVFEQKVANIEPGKQIDVNIRYYETLAYADGWYSFVFPTVVGPRYNPPGSNDPLLAVPRTQVRPTGSEAVRYLAPNERSSHEVSIQVEIDAGVAVEEIDASHALRQSRERNGVVRLALADGSMLPNRDFRLDFRVAGEQIKSNLLTYVDEDTGAGYFTMMMYPPAGLERLERQPLELVFVLDSSGSMNGAPIEQAKAAIIAALDRLEPGDTFQIIRFSQNASQFGPEPMPATRDNINAARRYVRQLSGSGGTQMIEGVRAALNFPHDEDRLRFVTFLTDGFIGNEKDILDAIDANLGASRIFSFGVGSSPNRYLLERMASSGRGAVAWLSLEQSGADVMDAFFDRIAHPAMIDVEIDWGGMRVADVYPRRLPDLFVGRPIVVTGRFSGTADAVRMSGRAAGRRVNVRFDHDASEPGPAFLPNLWARLKIADLNDQLATNPQIGSLVGAEIKETALAYKLMSDYTSFVAVDASQPTAGERGTTVYQSVPVPDGVRYETVLER